MVLAAANLIQSAAHGLPPLVGQLTRIEQATSKVNFYLIILTCTFLALAVVGLIARKIFNSPIESSDEEAVLSLSDLRRMHREGDLTDDEYQAARAAALAESGVYIGGEGTDDGATGQTVNQDPKKVTPDEDHPDTDPAVDPGVELGPELLNDPDGPTGPGNKPDNPG